MKKQSQVFNPYLPPWEYIPDGEPHIFGERLYVFGSHDNAKGKKYCENDYVCWSCPMDDLSDWRYEGIIYKKSQHPGNEDRKPLYAPDVAQGLDGKYYLYYSVENSSIISVAVCDTPTGCYEYLGDVHFPNGHVAGTAKEDWFQFDPAILVDTDGRVWLYSGSGQRSNEQYGHPVVGCFVMEMEPDMVTIKDGPKLLLPANDTRKSPNFFEGASIRHIDQLYYLIYPATDVTGLNYATSRYPDHDFTYRGRIHSTSDIGLDGRSVNQSRYPIGNNHGGLACIKGQWYIFDHRMTHNKPYMRQGVAEPISIEADGMIRMVETTSCGLNEGPLVGKGIYPAYIACNLMSAKFLGMRNPIATPYVYQDDADYSPSCSEKGESASSDRTPQVYIRDIKNGRLVGYKYFDFHNVSAVEMFLRGNAKGTIYVQTGEETGIIGEKKVKIASNEWINITIPLICINGKTALYFRLKGTGSLDMLQFRLL